MVEQKDKKQLYVLFVCSVFVLAVHQLHDRIDICLLCSIDRYMFHILPYLLFSCLHIIIA